MPDTLTPKELATIINDLDCIMGNGATGDDPRLGLDYGTAEEWAGAILARTGPLAHIDAMPEAHDKFEEYANRAIADRTEELLVLHKRIDAMTAAVRAVVDSWDCILPLSYSEQEVVAEKVAALQRILEEPKRE